MRFQHSTMEAELKSLVKVTAAVVASMAYARLASAHILPGFLRLLALLPVIALLPSLPWSFATLHLRAYSAFYLAWLALFKLILLSFALGPLHPSLPLPTFILTAALPVKLRPSSQPSKLVTTSSFRKYVTMVTIFAGMISLYPERHRFPHYLLLLFYGLHLYLQLSLMFGAAAFAAAIIGFDVEPQFDEPYKSTSLTDFWGRRWNLTVSAVLRPAVYLPVRSRCGPAAAVVSTFLVSGLMHEVMIYYFVLVPPRWEVTGFYVLHGVCVAVEGWGRRKGWLVEAAPVVKTAMTLGFLAMTGSWARSGAEEMAIEECSAMAAAVVGGGRAVLGWTGLARWSSGWVQQHLTM